MGEIANEQGQHAVDSQIILAEREDTGQVNPDVSDFAEEHALRWGERNEKKDSEQQKAIMKKKRTKYAEGTENEVWIKTGIGGPSCATETADNDTQFVRNPGTRILNVASYTDKVFPVRESLILVSSYRGMGMGCTSRPRLTFIYHKLRPVVNPRGAVA